MKKLISTSIISLIFLIETLATNTGYFKSDTFFVASTSKDKWIKALNSKKVRMSYYYGRGTWCGYAGEMNLELFNLSDKARKFIRESIQDDVFRSAGSKLREGDDFMFHNEPAVYFYHPSFNVEVHRLGIRYNPNFLEEFAEYPQAAKYKIPDLARPKELKQLDAIISDTKVMALDAKNIQIIIVSGSAPFVDPSYSKNGLKVRVWKNGVMKSYVISSTSKLKHNLVELKNAND